MKKAFVNTVESNDTDAIIELTRNLAFEQKQKDFQEKQKSMRQSLEREIDEMNQVTSSGDQATSKKRTRDDILADFDEFDDYTDDVQSEEERNSDDSILDADDINDLNDENFDIMDEIKLSK